MKKICAALTAALLFSSAAFGADGTGVLVSGGMVVGLGGEEAWAERVEIPAESGGGPVEIIYRVNSASLREAALPSSVKTVYTEAFTGCPSLERINLKDVTTVYDRAFEGCGALESVGGGNRFSTGMALGERAFAGSGLRGILLDRDLGEAEAEVFADCKRLCQVGFTSAVTRLGGGAFRGCSALGQLCLPASLDRLEGGVFSGCTGLRTVVFPAKNVELSDGAEEIFAGCEGLTLIGMAGTTAEAYARAHNLPFIPAVIPRSGRFAQVGEAVQNATVSVGWAELPAYTVNGSVYVGESALKSVGFNCKWDNSARTTDVIAPEGVIWSVTSTDGPERGRVGIVSTDIAFYCNGVRVPALNVGNNESIIDVNALAEMELY